MWRIIMFVGACGSSMGSKGRTVEFEPSRVIRRLPRTLLRAKTSYTLSEQEHGHVDILERGFFRDKCDVIMCVEV